MDTHVRDNLLAVGPHLIVRKTADESISSNTTLQNDDSLILPVAANEVWQFQFNCLVTGIDGADIKVAFTFPTSGDIGATTVWNLAAVSTASEHFWQGTTTPTTAVSLRCWGVSTRMLLPITGVFNNAGTGGSLTLQWAQVSSNATATIMKANSTLWAVKLA